MDKPTETLTEVSCAPECGFVVRSHDKDEVITLAKEHIDHKHPSMKLSREKIREMARSV